MKTDRNCMRVPVLLAALIIVSILQSCVYISVKSSSDEVREAKYSYSRQMHLASFNAIDCKCKGLCEIRYVQSAAPHILIEGTKKSLRNLEICVADSTLFIRRNSAAKRNKLRATVFSPNLGKVICDGMCVFKDDNGHRTQGSVYYALYGTADLIIDGLECSSFEVKGKGTSGIKADNTSCNTCILNMYHHSSIHLNKLNVRQNAQWNLNHFASVHAVKSMVCDTLDIKVTEFSNVDVSGKAQTINAFACEYALIKGNMEYSAIHRNGGNIKL